MNTHSYARNGGKTNKSKIRQEEQASYSQNGRICQNQDTVRSKGGPTKYYDVTEHSFIFIHPTTLKLNNLYKHTGKE
jgi:hypothetical protein